MRRQLTYNHSTLRNSGIHVQRDLAGVAKALRLWPAEPHAQRPARGRRQRIAAGDDGTASCCCAELDCLDEGLLGQDQRNVGSVGEMAICAEIA
jgi:hypothetical protein